MFRVQKEDAPGCVVSASVSIPPDKVDPIIFFIMKHHEESCSLRAVNVSGLLWLEHRMWKCEINLLSPKVFQPPPRLLFHSRVHPYFSSTHRLSVTGWCWGCQYDLHHRGISLQRPIFIYNCSRINCYNKGQLLHTKMNSISFKSKASIGNNFYFIKLTMWSTKPSILRVVQIVNYIFISDKDRK